MCWVDYFNNADDDNDVQYSCYYEAADVDLLASVFVEHQQQQKNRHTTTISRGRSAWYIVPCL